MHAVLADVESSGLDEQHKALFRFIDKVNHDSPRITPEDLDVARAAGWSDEALYFAITVCALFNFYNRWIDASGVHRCRTKPIDREASEARSLDM